MQELQEVGRSSDEKTLDCAILTPEQVVKFWKQIEERLDKDPVLWNRSLTKEGILTAIIVGEIQVWALGRDGNVFTVFMTRVYRCENGLSILQIFWGHGKDLMKNLLLIDLVLDQYAAERNCSRIEGQGRLGFAKKAKKLGWEFDHLVYSRPVRKQRGH